MEMPETEATATKRQVWNAGRMVGAKRALKPKQIGKSDSTSISAAACGIVRYSTSRSTANFVAATSFGLKSATLSAAGRYGRVQS